LLAETGLLKGREATIHWALAPTFHRNFPDVRLRTEEVLIAHEDIVMTGGVMSWHDLALYLIARYVGPVAAQAMARMLMLEWHGAGQAPYIEFTPELGHGDGLVAERQRWLERHYMIANPVEEMTTGSGLSRRTLERRFRKATGRSPISYVQQLRIREARRLLERTTMPIDEIGFVVGYENTAFFRAPVPTHDPSPSRLLSTKIRGGSGALSARPVVGTRVGRVGSWSRGSKTIGQVGYGHRLQPPDRRRASGYHQADMEQRPPQRVRRRAVQGLARPSRSAPGTGTCRRSRPGSNRTLELRQDAPPTMYLALGHGIWLPTTRWWRGGHQIAIVEAFAARQRTCSVFIAHDLDSDKTRLLRDGRISAVLHHDLRQDVRQACYAIMQAHKALPGAIYSWPSNIHVITPYNIPAPALSHP
jgi:AraC-like DNA-binding protein